MEPSRWQDIPVEELAEGVRRQVLWGENATVASISLARGKHVSRHKHESEQFTSLVSGSMRMNLAGQELVLRAGDVLIIPPWVEHEVWALEDCVVVDYFAPPRHDWKEGNSRYLTGR
jgi:quercetin dioxygenase-like cupin family protein